jgi:hypothetical protein
MIIPPQPLGTHFLQNAGGKEKFEKEKEKNDVRWNTSQ